MNEITIKGLVQELAQDIIFAEIEGQTIPNKIKISVKDLLAELEL